jgi:hypothetical protein
MAAPSTPAIRNASGAGLGSSGQFGATPGSRDSGGSVPELTPNHENFQTLMKQPAHRVRKRKSGSTTTAGEETSAEEEQAISEQESREAQLLREFDRAVRFTSFRFHSNKFHPAVIRKIYGNIPSTSSVYVVAKTKLFDNVRTHKNNMIKKLEVRPTFDLLSSR